MKVYLASIGCRLNQSEMDSLARQLRAAGHEVVAEPEAADKVIVNTCAVTAAAAKDARALARRSRRVNGRAELIMTGCYATVAPEEIGRLGGVERVVPNRDKHRLIELIDPEATRPGPRPGREATLVHGQAIWPSPIRAFVKVQDGCGNRCTFCITTLARGESRSRHVGDVVVEIQALSAAGCQEAVLTGVHLGSYGHDVGAGASLAGLVTAVLAHTDIPRLRLSSLEPWDLEPGFFALWRDPRLLPHLHLPLQSGSDDVLRRMGRRTSRATFRALAAAARAAIPSLNLTTDLIAGFPGESEADFQATLDYVAETGFGRLHVFPYSRRPGTAAARMPGQLPDAVRKQRARRLIALGAELSLAFHQRFEGQSAEVLWEGAAGLENRWSGYTGNYIRVTAEAAADLRGRVTPARLVAATSEGLTGHVLLEVAE
jgi:threonylcarbamoyladenosine tRNA methylthiotransferase MtaB